MKLDAQHLLELAREKSAKSKTELADIVDSLFDERGGALSDRERSLMFNIIQHLVREVEVSVRQKLSEKLAKDPATPLALAKTLAADKAEVAFPILSKSKVLRDEDLIEIIHLRTEEYHLAITLREGIGEGVCDALVETENVGVIKSLLKNDSASLSQATMGYLVEQSKRVDTFQEPLLHRSELSETLAKKMFMWVSAALRTDIVDRYDIDTATVDRLLEQAAQEGYQASQNERDEPESELIKSLRERGMITPVMLVQTLSDGEIPLFLAILADLTKLNTVIIRRIVFEKGGHGIAIACRAIDLSELDFATIFRKSRRVAPGRAKATREEVNTILDMYRSIVNSEARKVVELWQCDNDYQDTIEGLLAKI
ncbi:MAG: DUF2336 domain-containing protein [Magnetovibrio sp.]|nr:DUF2336 domain-containing protein [Magnetovibrio sp.]